MEPGEELPLHEEVEGGAGAAAVRVEVPEGELLELGEDPGCSLQVVVPRSDLAGELKS
jgi:hypothetical protein